MRDIKFRAWNGEVMEYGGFNIHASEGKIVTYTCLSRVKEGCPLMQFTGLHDKNGKEIYESDILRYSSIHSDEHMLGGDKTIGVVIWHESRCGFVPQDVKENHRGGNYITPWDFAHDIEVIGNIHESPEATK